MRKHKDAARFLLAAIAMMILIALHSVAQNVSESELQFREAQHKQTVEGDLSNAIKIYQNIVSSKTADRAVKAKSLLQLAACYEKLGQKSEAVYQQIVRDFPGQPEAAQARAKLEALKPPVSPPTLTMRKIEMGKSVQNVVATDGQRAVYWDSTNTILYIGDVAGKDKRIVYQTTRAVRVEASRDLGTLFFYFPQSQEPASYAVIRTDGTGFRTLTLSEKGEKISAQPLTTLSWSWDSRHVLISYPRADGTHLLRVSIADGAVQDILAGRTTRAAAAELSPDGRFVAYYEGPLIGLGPVRIMPIEGGESHLISKEGRLGGWSRDGRHLLFGEVRSGSMELFIMPIQNGKPSGEPVIQQSSLGWATPQSMLNGTMVMRFNNRSGDNIFLATLDTQNRLSAWKPLELISSGPAFLSWSPDGREIVYSASQRVRVRNLITGADREVYRSERRVDTCTWAHQSTTVYCAVLTGTSTEIMAISVDSGRTEKAGTLEGGRNLSRISPDDRVIAGINLRTRTTYEWEIGTVREKILGDIVSSEDGRWFLDTRTPDQENRRQMRVRPATGAETDWKLVAHFRGPAILSYGPSPLRFAPDGSWVIYRDKDPNGKDGLYRVFTANGEPERLGDYPASQDLGFISISRDGRQIIVEGMGQSNQ